MILFVFFLPELSFFPVILVVFPGMNNLLCWFLFYPQNRFSDGFLLFFMHGSIFFDGFACLIRPKGFRATLLVIDKLDFLQEFENMKRNLANKEMIIHKLRAEIDVLKTTVEILRKEVMCHGFFMY